MTIDVSPARGGFLRPFGCGWFIREYLMGHGPEGSRVIEPARGATQTDINYEYKEALARATARERAEKIISRYVLKGVDISEEQAEEIYQRELTRISRKFTHMRYHSFLVYFSVLKRLNWVEPSGETEPSAIQDSYPPGPARVYYRLTEEGIRAGESLWSNPLFTLYPEISPGHRKKPG